MDGADLADEAGPKFRQHPACLHQDTPAPLRVFGIIGRMLQILFEWCSVFHFDRRRPYFHTNPQRSQGGHRFLIELSHRALREANGPDAAITGFDAQRVIEEIEFHFERTILVRHRQCRQPASRDVERDVPPVIHERHSCKPDLSDDLRPHVERRIGVLPIVQSQRGPYVSGMHWFPSGGSSYAAHRTIPYA